MPEVRVKLAAAVAAAAAALLCVLALLGVVLSGGQAALACAQPATAGGSGPWVATAYGPPWGGIQGSGITATGLDLTEGPPALEVAVDPSVIPLGSYVHVEPNPFGTKAAFYAGDTGGAVTGQHVDIYDWKGRPDQEAWGKRPVSVTPAAKPGAGNLLGGVAPVPEEPGGSTLERAVASEDCAASSETGAIGLTPTQTAHIQPDGSASIPSEVPPAVRRALEAGNLIHTLPYPEPDVHYGTLTRIWPAYDCSGATSFVLYEAGLLSATALVSGQLESYGLPGPGRWITVYANSAHAWIVVAGIALDTAGYGGPSIPAGSGPRWRSDPLANLQDGTSYVARHPAGL